MAQQINLCSPLQRPRTQSFSAHTMAQALAIFLVLGGVLCGVWLWKLQTVSLGFQQTLSDQARDIQGLKTALESVRSSTAPLNPALAQQLQAKRVVLAQREQLMQALQQGLLQAGLGHSDRLNLLARTIPAPVWLSEVKADSAHFELSGFTLEPAALNGWVSSLSQSPLMQGLKLATVKVENAAASQERPALAGPAGQGASSPPATRAVWSFHLVSAQAASGPDAEGKP